MLSPEIASVIPRFFDAGKGPSHDELTLLFRQTGLAGADPGVSGPGGPIGKMKRVRRVLIFALDEHPDAGARLVRQLVDMVRGSGGFHPGTEDYIGDATVAAARRAFADVGYDLDVGGHLRPATFENLEGGELTEALWAYVRRARSGASDSPQVVGTAKDLAEAVASAHARRLAHRAPPPRSALVIRPGAAEQRLCIINWQTGSREGGGATAGTVEGTRHVDQLIDTAEAAYLAPEVLTVAGADPQLLDVFSLGAIAYLVFTGQPPAH